jgi:hypothetical protein
MSRKIFDMSLFVRKNKYMPRTHIIGNVICQAKILKGAFRHDIFILVIGGIHKTYSPYFGAQHGAKLSSLAFRRGGAPML